MHELPSIPAAQDVFGLLHLGVFTAAFCCLGKVAFLINLVSSTEYVFS